MWRARGLTPPLQHLGVCGHLIYCSLFYSQKAQVYSWLDYASLLSLSVPRTLRSRFVFMRIGQSLPLKLRKILIIHEIAFPSSVCISRRWIVRYVQTRWSGPA